MCGHSRNGDSNAIDPHEVAYTCEILAGREAGISEDEAKGTVEKDRGDDQDRVHQRSF